MVEATNSSLLINDARPFITYGHRRIHYTRLNRRNDVHRVLIKVQPNLQVEAHAPASISEVEVREAVRMRAGWIARQLRQLEGAAGSNRAFRYRSGESHHYLGKQYVLKVFAAGKQPESVRLMQGRFDVVAKGRSPERVKRLLDDWFVTHAENYFRRRVEFFAERLPWVTSSPSLVIKPMLKRWGSCSPSGRLTLNQHLIHAPRVCVDYVIIHELCHLVERSHGKRFMELLNSAMPGWQDPKNVLDHKVVTWLRGV